MQIVNELWEIDELIKNEKVINPKPQYQRTPVWTADRKAYLIDSILRGYDLPKFYVKLLVPTNRFKFEVADGQQRMRAIWDFYDDLYPLSKNVQIDGHDLSLKRYSELPQAIQQKFLHFDLNISMVLTNETGELNELFTRLQKGVTLNPPELRHAMYSSLGFYVDSFLERQKVKDFFASSGIKDSRFKYQDYIDHLFSLMHFKNKKDLKAAIMSQAYIDFAESKNSEFKPYFDDIELILTKMKEINTYSKGVFKNKWAFVDYGYLLHKNKNKIRSIDSKEFAKNVQEFEEERIKFNSKPEKLLKLKRVKFGKILFEYIQAFNKEGSKKENISIRNMALEHVFNSFFR
ncbi:MAG: DUF262 domain-containing protein [Agriterribacter sp.]